MANDFNNLNYRQKKREKIILMTDLCSKNAEKILFERLTVWKNVIKMMISFHFKTINKKFSANLAVEIFFIIFYLYNSTSRAARRNAIKIQLLSRVKKFLHNCMTKTDIENASEWNTSIG